ncbi:MAG: ankyrin repeat domain-containing protein [Leptospira sp.]|nr:ankyrin repeat domain-containing protein [Leptospira sp.]
MKPKFVIPILIALLGLQCVNFPNQRRTDDRYFNFFYQVAIGDTDRVRQMIREGADVNQPEDTFERLTPLMIAAKEGHDAMAYLLLTFNANPNAKTRNGHTALMIAAYNRYPKIVKILLEAGADPNIKSNAGHTALSEVTLSDKEEIILLLTEKGGK